MATLWMVEVKVPESSLLASHYIASHRSILAIMIVALAPVSMGMVYQSLMPIFAGDVLKGDARTQGFLLTGMGVGALFRGFWPLTFLATEYD